MPLVAAANQYAWWFAVVNEPDRTYADVSIGLDMLKKDETVVRLDYTEQFSDSTSTKAIGETCGHLCGVPSGKS